MAQRLDYKVAHVLATSNGLTVWPDIMRNLSMMEHDIKAIEREYPRDIKSQCVEALIRWWTSQTEMDDETKTKKIIGSVRNEGLTDVAERLIASEIEFSSNKTTTLSACSAQIPGHGNAFSQSTKPLDKNDDYKVEEVGNKVIKIIKDRYKEAKFGILKLLEGCRAGMRHIVHVFTDMKYIREDLLGNEVDSEFHSTQSLDECFSQSEFPRRVAIQGDPGIGKTTLCHKLCADWATSEISSNPLKRFKLVCLIHLRELNTAIPNSEIDIVDLMQDAGLLPCDELHKDEVSLLREYISGNPDSVCIIFDGLDELKDSLHATILKYWRGHKYRQTPIILTTRPELGNKLREDVTDGYFFILNGFDRDMRNRFIKSFFESSPDMQKRATRSLLKTRKMSHLTSNPMSLTLMCILLEELRGELPLTQTQITHQAILTLIKRDVIRSSPQYRIDNVVNINKLPQKYLQDVKVISKFAFELLSRDVYTFKHLPACSHYGTIVTIDNSASYTKEKEYQFQHRSYQEFFASLYIKDQYEAEGVALKTYFEILKKKPDLCRYLCGFLGQPAIEIIGELFKTGTTRNNGDDVWLSCSSEAIECRRELETCDEDVYVDKRTSFHTSLYEECFTNSSSESIACSSTCIMALIGLVAEDPTNQMWSSLNTISLDCKQKWTLGFTKKEMEEYNLTLASHRSTAPLIGLLACITDADIMGYRFKVEFKKDKCRLEVQISRIANGDSQWLCAKLCASLKCSGLKLVVRELFLEGVNDLCVNAHGYPSNLTDLDLVISQVNVGKNLEGLDSDTESESEVEEDISSPSYNEKGTEQEKRKTSNQLKSFLARIKKNMSSSPKHPFASNNVDQKKGQSSRNKNSMKSFLDSIKGRITRSPRKSSHSNIGQETSNFHDTSEGIPTSNSFDASKQSNPNNLEINKQGQANDLFHIGMVSEMPKLEMLSISCPLTLEYDGDICDITRLKPDLLSTSNLKHIILNGLQKTEASLIKDLLLNHSLDSLILLQKKNDSFHSDIIHDIHVFMKQVKVLGIIREESVPSLDVGGTPYLDEIVHIQESCLTSEMSKIDLGPLSQEQIQTFLGKDSVMRLQDSLAGKIVRACEVDMWLRSDKKMWIVGGYVNQTAILELSIWGGEVTSLSEIPGLPYEVAGHCAAVGVHGGTVCLVLAGGKGFLCEPSSLRSASRRLNLVWMLDCFTEQWIRLPDLNTDMLSPCGFMLGDRMYVVAGGSGESGEHHSIVESLCITNPESKWQDEPWLPRGTGGAGMAACVVKQSVFLTGGHLSNRCMLEWQDRWPEWQRKTDMNQSHTHHAMCTDGLDRIWVLGGWDESSVEEYNTRTDQWTFLPSLPHPRSNTGAVFFAGHIYLPGGWGSDDTDAKEHVRRDSVYVFDLRTMTWSRSPIQLPTGVTRCPVLIV